MLAHNKRKFFALLQLAFLIGLVILARDMSQKIFLLYFTNKHYDLFSDIITGLAFLVLAFLIVNYKKKIDLADEEKNK